jgi:hypothetical protein
MQISRFFETLVKSAPRLAVLASMVAVTPLLAPGQENHQHKAPAKLVQIVREATQQYIDVNNAGPDYIPLFGCVSGPDHGAHGHSLHQPRLSG